jgi:hypothetical protein
MYSKINPSFLYTNISRDVCEHDINVVSDLWTIEGREVYRGIKDTSYTHADVYWLYDENLERVGCIEHSRFEHATYHALWFDDNPFAMLFQEADWKTKESLWNTLPRIFVDYCLANNKVTAKDIQELTLDSNIRIITPAWCIERPTLYVCKKCGVRSMFPLPTSCQAEEQKLDIGASNFLFCIDDDFIVYEPPKDSRITTLPLPYVSPPPELVVAEQTGSVELPQPEPEAPQTLPPSLVETPQEVVLEVQPPHQPQEPQEGHPQTYPSQLSETEQIPSHIQPEP